MDNDDIIIPETAAETETRSHLENEQAVEIISGLDHSRIVERRTVENVMEDSYLRYSMSVIINRAVPDVRDGLKPVHPPILYTVERDGLRSRAPHRKSATVVGAVMGDYHPHGDASIYDSMVRMAQD